MIIDRTARECPFRSNGKCNVVVNRNECDENDAAYPEWCPLLQPDHEVIVRPILPAEGVLGKVDGGVDKPVLPPLPPANRDTGVPGLEVFGA